MDAAEYVRGEVRVATAAFGAKLRAVVHTGRTIELTKRQAKADVEVVNVLAVRELHLSRRYDREEATGTFKSGLRDATARFEWELLVMHELEVLVLKQHFCEGALRLPMGDFGEA